MDLDEIMERGGVTKDLGMEFVTLDPDEVVATMPVDARHHQPLGFLHGGVSVTLAESVATIGGWLNCAPGKGVRIGDKREPPQAEAVRDPDRGREAVAQGEKQPGVAGRDPGRGR
jgi:hypothetical protein